VPPAPLAQKVAALARKRGSWVAVSVALIAAVCACQARTSVGTTSARPDQLTPVALAPGQNLRVVATTSIVADIVHQVGGARIDLTTLMGSGVDPHTYVATPSDTALVHDANLLMLSGAGLEEGLSKILQGASGSAVEVQLSGALRLEPASLGSGAQQAPTDTSTDELDPHVWMDVQNVVEWVQTIRDTLSALDPAGSAYYQANADAYAAQLRELDNWILDQVASIPQDRRRLMTNHLTLGYFARRYGFEQVGAIYPLSPSSEPSARDIAALEEAIRRYGLHVLFTENTVSPKLADQVARDTGVKTERLYTESIGPSGSGAESYIEMMRYDVQAIVAGLR
jgi:manganese/iron transport system substrate-binding protein